MEQHQPLSFQLNDDDPWHVSKKAFDLLSEYLQQNLSSSEAQAPKDTATALDALTPFCRVPQDGEEIEEAESFLLEFWETFLGVVRQTPHNHVAQHRLVALVAELERLPPEKPDLPNSIWAHLGGLSNTLLDIWKAPSEAEDSYEVFSQWTNLNSFAARLFGQGLLEDCSLGVWTMADSLEKTATTTSADLLECRVLTAARWVEHGADPLFNFMTQKNLEPSTASGLVKRSRERWDSWKGKFQDIGKSGEDLPEKVKECALEAVRKMDEAEKTEEIREAEVA